MLSAVIFRSGNLPCNLTLRRRLSYFFILFLFRFKDAASSEALGTVSGRVRGMGVGLTGKDRKTADTCGGRRESVG